LGDRDLERIGLANQTTMLMSESMEIQEMLQAALRDRYGEAELPARFRAFDTICSATQDRQDAVLKMLKEGGNLILLDEPTNDLDVETLSALEAALEDFPGCVVVISHDRFFLDRIATHILAFEGLSHVEWFEGNFQDYEADKKRRLGDAAVEPHRVKFKRFERQ